MPDFGIFRGFNKKLFGEKLYAGQLPTQLGLIGSEDFGFDIDALAFFDRVDTAGGTLSATEQAAVNQLVIDMKEDGIWTKMKAIYPMVGASSAACAQNLKSSSFTGTFNGGWTFASTGVTPNGTNGYMDTGLYGPTYLSTDGGIGIYSVNEVLSSGAFGTGTNLHIYPRFTDGNTYYRIFNTNGNQVSNNTSKGFIHGYGSSSLNEGNAWFNGTKKDSSAFSVSVDASNVFFGGQRPRSSNYDNHQMAFAFVSNYLTDTEASDFYDAVQAFQTTLSREV